MLCGTAPSLRRIASRSRPPWVPASSVPGTRALALMPGLPSWMLTTSRRRPAAGCDIDVSPGCPVAGPGGQDGGVSTSNGVEVEAGTLAGTVRGRVTLWLGVPYAEPPVGRLRFTAPAKVRPWRGVRPATLIGGAAQQPTPVRAATRGLGTPSED